MIRLTPENSTLEERLAGIQEMFRDATPEQIAEVIEALKRAQRILENRKIFGTDEDYGLLHDDHPAWDEKR